jgi:hypothetical protein
VLQQRIGALIHQCGRRSREIGRASEPGWLATQRLEVKTDQAVRRLHRARKFLASLRTHWFRASFGVVSSGQRELVVAVRELAEAGGLRAVECAA